MFAVPLARRGEVFLSIPGWSSRHDATRLLYVSTLPRCSNCTGIYKHSLDDKGRAAIIAWTERALMKMACFFAAFRNGNASHSVGYFQFDQHRGGIPAPLTTGVLKDVKVLGLYDVICLAGCDPVLCFMAVRRSQEIDWPR